MASYSALALAINQHQTSFQNNNPLINPSDFLSCARSFVCSEFLFNLLPSLVRVERTWLVWKPSNWRVVCDEFVDSCLYRWLGTCVQQITRRGQTSYVPVPPSERLVREIKSALTAIASVELPQAPAWLVPQAGLPSPDFVIPFTNGVFDPVGNTLLPSNPSFLGLATSPVVFNPNSNKPTNWLNFLDFVFAQDHEQIRCLQEAFGYCLSQATRWEHLFLLIGEPASGKSTIAEVLTALVGRETVAEFSPNHLQSDAFYTHYLVNKSLAVARDLRLDDSTRKGQHVVSMMLSIATGEPIPVRAMHKGFSGERLCTRQFIIANPGELILSDQSKALLRRLIALETKRSALGQEDPFLKDKLLLELPGIANWAIEGLKRAMKRGRVENPLTSQKLLAVLEQDLGDQVENFAKERLAPSPRGLQGPPLPWREIRNAHETWCAEEGERPVSAKRLRDRLARIFLNTETQGLHRAERGVKVGSEKVVYGLCLKAG